METLNTKHNLLNRIRGHRLTSTFALMAALTVGIIAGSVLTHGASAKEQQVDSSDARPLSIPAAVQSQNEFSKIAKAVGPAVVVINTEQLPKQAVPAQSRNRRRSGQQAAPDDGQGQGGQGQNGDPGDLQDYLRRFFGGQGGDDENGMGGPGGQTEQHALGSGFIVDPRGYIITNNHVVDNADRIYVKLSTDPDNGSTDLGRPAHLIGTDKDTDIAVIKIDSKEPLPTVRLGNSDGAQVGDWVLAIGSPFELSQTVSAGIVSAKNRSVTDGGPSSQFQRFIQTDAAINPGNSGGPLVDMAGQVIGMNTAIFTQSRGSEGVGFAMPSNTIVNVYNMLISPSHKVVRGSIGIQFQNAVAGAVSRRYGITSGVLVGAVTPNTGAAKAGIQPGDIITSIDGRNIKDGDDMVSDISSRRVGSTVKLGYIRDGKQSTANVTIGDRSTLAQLGGEGSTSDDATPGETSGDAGQGKLGMSVEAVPANTISKLGLHGGVAVTDVKPGSFASEVGLARGVIITAINRKPVNDKNDYNGIVSSLKSGDDVAFEVRLPRASGTTYLGGTLP